MGYKINIGNELSQIKNYHDIDDIKHFLEDHNLILDHYYFNTASDSDKKGLYVVAYYEDPDGVFIHITFNF